MLRLCDGLVDLDRIQRLRLAIEEGRKEMREVLLFILRAYNKQQKRIIMAPSGTHKYF